MQGANRAWGGARQGAPWTGSPWSRDALALSAPATGYPTVEEPGGAAALAVSHRRLDRGLLRGALGTLGARGARALSVDDQPAQTGLARSTDAGAKLQPPGQQ